MRVIQVVNTFSVADGGPARNSFELYLAINKVAGASSRIISCRTSPGPTVVSTHHGKLPQRTPLQLAFAALPEFVKELRSADVAIVHGYYLSWIPIVLLLARSRGVPVVLTPHGSLTSHQQRFSVIKKRLFDAATGWIYRRFTSLIVVGSEIERSELPSRLNTVPVAVCGVGTPLNVPLRQPRAWSNPLKLVTVGRIAPKKRLDLSLEAIAILRERSRNAELLIAGTGTPEFTDTVLGLTKRLNIQDQVKMLGMVVGEAKASLLSDADIFLLPSDDENFGIAAAEALAAGVPVVLSEAVAAASNLPAAAGFRLPKPDASSLADAIEAVASGDPATASAAARAYAESHFSWSAVAAKWITAISDLHRPR